MTDFQKYKDFKAQKTTEYVYKIIITLVGVNKFCRSLNFLDFFRSFHF